MSLYLKSTTKVNLSLLSLSLSLSHTHTHTHTHTYTDNEAAHVHVPHLTPIFGLANNIFFFLSSLRFDKGLLSFSFPWYLFLLFISVYFDMTQFHFICTAIPYWFNSSSSDQLTEKKGLTLVGNLCKKVDHD